MPKRLAARHARRESRKREEADRSAFHENFVFPNQYQPKAGGQFRSITARGSRSFSPLGAGFSQAEREGAVKSGAVFGRSFRNESVKQGIHHGFMAMNLSDAFIGEPNHDGAAVVWCGCAVDQTNVDQRLNGFAIQRRARAKRPEPKL